MLSPATFKALRESGAVPGAEYLLEVDNVRKEFPGVVALLTWSIATSIATYRAQRDTEAASAVSHAPTLS